MKYNRLTAMLCITSLLAASLTGCAKEAQSNTDSDSSDSQTAIDEMDSLASQFEASNLMKHSDKSGKEETVYVIMDANGANPETIVSEWLKNPHGTQTLTDTSTLNNIEVVKGVASYVMNGANSLSWDAYGEDVYYQGTTDKDLPVNVSVSYTLDGQPVDASALSNVTGHIKIDYNYNNKIYKVVQIGNESCNIYQPFTTITGLLLDDTKVSNIEVTDGKVINNGDYSIVFGVAMPGLMESLGLNELEDDKDVHIPESVSIEADVVDFSMPMTMTLVSNNALTALDLDDLNSIDDLKDKIAELEDGIDQIVDGAEQLYDGMNELQDGTTELSDGVTELDDGAGDLKDGAHELADGAGELRNGASQLYDGTGSLKNGTEQLKNGLNTLNGKTPELASGVSQLNDGAGKLSAGANDLIANNDKLNGGAAQLAGGLSQLNDSLKATDVSANMAPIITGSAQVKSGIESLGTAAGGIAGGLNQAPSKESCTSVTASLSALKNATIGEGEDKKDVLTDDQKALLESAISIINGYSTIVYGNGSAENPGIKAAINQMNIGLNGDGSTENPGLVAKYAALDSGLNRATTTIGQKMSTMASAVDQLNTGASSLKEGVNAYTAGASQLQAGASQLSAGTSKLNASVPALVDGVSQLSAGADQLNSGAGSLRDGAGKLYDGTDKLANGANDLADGTNKLKDGTTELKDGVSELTDGVSQLVDGSGKLTDGIIKFNDEGISKIVDLVDNDLEAYYDRLCAVKDFAKEYTSFTSNEKNEDNSVKFIYKTNPVEDMIKENAISSEDL